MPQHDSNILLIHSGALGDFLLALHLTTEMKQSGARVNYLGGSEHGELGVIGGFLTSAHDIAHADFHQLYTTVTCPFKVAQLIEKHDFILFSSAHPQRDEIAAILASASGVKAIAFDPRANESKCEHVTQQWRQQIEDAGMELKIESARLNWPATEIARAAERTRWKEGCTRIIIQPGSGGASKNWPLEGFLELAIQLKQCGNADIRFLLGPVEQETWNEEVRARIANIALCVTGLSLNDCAGFIASADAFIGNDSGTGHLAAALGKRTLSIFGATSPRVWRPLGQKASIIGENAKWPTREEVFLKARELSAIVDA